MSFLSIDIGSSRCKGTLFSVAGDVLSRLGQAYAPDFPRPSHAEMDPEKFWHAVCHVSRALSQASGDDAVQGVCFSSHGETFIPAGVGGEPVGPAILNIDNRATRESAWLGQMIDREHLFQITGQIAHPMYSIPKILWLRKHRPAIFHATKRFFSVTDYLLMRLGLPPYIDYSLASRFLAFDVRQRRWSDEILSLTDLKADTLPIPVQAGTVAGNLTTEMAGLLALPKGVSVIVGGHDQACGALGVGVIGSGRVSDSMGTYECIVAASDLPQLGKEALHACLNSYCHVVPEKFITLAYFPAGIMVQWFHELLRCGSGEAETESEEGNAYARLESLAPAGPSGLLVTPHLIGSCNPDFNPQARAAISGLSANSGRGHIYKGILEGLACELSQMTEILATSAGDFTDIYATGGGTRSALGLRLRAALTGRRIHLMRCQEAVCLGGAILAGVATGIYKDIPEAVAQMVHEEVAVIEPDRQLASEYASQVKNYRLFYSALARVRDRSEELIQPGEET
jgi:xylulokinase